MTIKKNAPKRTVLAGSAIATVLALGTALPGEAEARKVKFEKCFGVAKAGKNDCQTATSACAGTSKTDKQADAYVYVPKGLCLKLADGNLGADAKAAAPASTAPAPTEKTSAAAPSAKKS